MSVVGVILGVPRSVAIDPSEGAWQALAMRFEILGEISGLETFATGSGIREIARLRKTQGASAPAPAGGPGAFSEWRGRFYVCLN
jgi:hypothetical protein